MPRFNDDAEAAGLRFTFENNTSPGRQMPEASSGGVGLLDYDGDGWLDVYVVQGGLFPPLTHAGRTKRAVIGYFRNKGNGTFEDVSERSASLLSLVVTATGSLSEMLTMTDGPTCSSHVGRSYALYRNRGDGTFEDVTESWGLAGNRDWPTSAAFADFDGDGDLDLYVCHYLEWDSEHPPSCYDKVRKTYGGCSPPDYKALPDHLFRNDGGRFRRCHRSGRDC